MDNLNDQWLPTARTKLESYKSFIENLPDSQRKKAHHSSRRLLDVMLDYAPINEGRLRVAKEIIKADDEDILLDLGVYYRANLIMPFRAQGGRTPAPTDHPSGESAAFDREIIVSEIEDAKSDRGEMKRYALQRDNYRCLASGILDEPSSRQKPELGTPYDTALPTEAAHILPFSLCSASGKAQLNHSAAVWETIQVFSGIPVTELNGDNINRLENLLTLTGGHHTAFGMLNLWFEPVEYQVNQYRIRKLSPRLLGPPDGQILTFTSPDPAALPLPKREYLALHAACANIAHASGATEEIDEFLEKWEGIKVLAADGSSFALLAEALSYQVAGIPVR